MSDAKKSSKDASSHTLTDNDIKTERSIGRRSLFALVAGAAGAGLAACVQVNPARTGGGTVSNPAGGGGTRVQQSGLTDNDPQDQPGNGSGPRYSGLNDSDSGNSAAGSDNAGYGRTGPQPTGFSDNDPVDSPGYGQGRAYSGRSDSDGPGSAGGEDQPGYGY